LLRVKTADWQSAVDGEVRVGKESGEVRAGKKSGDESPHSKRDGQE